jgi:hypothetical protein
MPAGKTYEPIATTSPTNNPTELIFTSIPSTYTDLVLVVTAKSPGGGDIYIHVNSDTGSNYSWTTLTGNGSSAQSARGSNTSAGLLVDYHGTVANDNAHLLIANFLNYSNSTTFKTCISRSNRAGNGVDANVSLWRSTNAINSLKLGLGSARTATFSTGTVATLYGIASA